MNETRKAYLKSYKAEYRKTTKQVTITLSQSEAKELEKRAQQEGVKLTTLVKNLAIAYHQQTPYIPASLEHELQETRFLFRNIANNINQIAHHSNTIKRLADENGLLLEIQKLETLVLDYFTRQTKP